MQTQDEDFAGENTMKEIIEADFFPSAVETITDASHTLIVDNKPNAADSVDPSTRKASGASTFEAIDTKARV
jgi:hypothetical protein